MKSSSNKGKSSEGRYSKGTYAEVGRLSKVIVCRYTKLVDVRTVKVQEKNKRQRKQVNIETQSKKQNKKLQTNGKYEVTRIITHFRNQEKSRRGKKKRTNYSVKKNMKSKRENHEKTQ